ncbi:transcriptional regulator with HTH domain and aminotransferase domain containing protein [Herbaspirillum sp. CF444]|uniref:aminotransferase-like domain-containing protein n=1 Tax=Herbaspirillum sp. CF444 TaxID=1144319 RepID=UPI0002727E32|nr:PLP-dependent aminotransferase family protein [Herbaspirillum sp. CF444]EJL93258.1 transcriptional regulator with HTH domain and aminotransferase domain containing protein [Herbaspirillum sp. CF444]
MKPAYRFNPAFQTPQGSPIRELFKYTQQPGMISFAGGYPSPALFDADALAHSGAAVLRESPTACLQYGATEGVPALTEALRALTQQRTGGKAAAENLLVTTGSQQAFELLLRVLVGPGDCVAIERPAYPAAIQALRLANAEMLEIPSDGDGMDTQALEQLLLAGARPKLLYVVPTFANPTGATLPSVRRRHLLELAVRYRMLVIEDDPYGELRFAGAPQPLLLEVADDVPGGADWLVYLSSLSKIVAPGLRIGWMCGPAEILRRAVIAKQTGDLCTAPWMQLAAARYLRDGCLARHLPTIIATYKDRCETMLASLRECFGESLEVTVPQGGMFIWARWRDGTEATTLLQQAVIENVMYVPGGAFYASAADPARLRLSFATASPEEIRTGMTRLRTAHGKLRDKLQD